MLKFIKGHMDSIEGINIYPIISLAIFFTFFIMLGVWVFIQRKEHIDYLSKMPFDDNNESDNTNSHV
jgi:cytochrome c oxidase cbb3-type subunit IV